MKTIIKILVSKIIMIASRVPNSRNNVSTYFVTYFMIYRYICIILTAKCVEVSFLIFVWIVSIWLSHQ